MRRMRHKKRFLPLYSILAILGGLILTAFVIVADKLADKNIYFYINFRGITPGKVYVVIVCLACFLFVTGINAFLHRNFRSFFLKGIILLGVLMIACYLAFSTLFSALFFMPRAYVGAYSPDGQHQIIVGEDNRLSAPYGGTVYERTSLITIRKVGEYEVGGEFAKPFSSGKFYVDWDCETFDVHYDYDNNGNYKTVTFSYVK